MNSPEYSMMKRNRLRGWNTWNSRSVTSHVLLPDGFAISLGFKEWGMGDTWQPRYLPEVLVGRSGEHEEKVHPGAHAYDGSYTDLRVSWRGVEFRVRSATDRDDIVLLVTPIKNRTKPVTVTIESGLLWNRPGVLRLEGESLVAELPERTVRVRATAATVFDPNVGAKTPYLAVPLAAEFGVSTGAERSLDEIRAVVARRAAGHEAHKARYGELADAYDAMQTCLAWDTIYEPRKDRMVSPVSRIWNNTWGGYVLFCWDTYFGAIIASLDDREIAYGNAIEITREKTPDGFVPNFAGDDNFWSRDRSQPPVGTLAVRELYRRYREEWLLREVFDDLLVWNRWWDAHRQVAEGLLAWGSDPYEPVFGAKSEWEGVGDTHGGALESGLDNSPMYDDVPFDEERHVMLLADVGLTSLYAMDCAFLAEIADVLGKSGEAAELRERVSRYEAGIATLWNDELGIFCNRRADTGEFSTRLSPTNFYALLTDVPTTLQARRMIDEHFYNPDEFWGDWIMPSIARNDPAFPEQRYWRGKIWAPLNYLVYLGLRRHDLNDARRDLAEKSADLLLREWREHGHVHENYTATTGIGCDKPDSDRFYHWGGLLGLIPLIEAGFVEGPETPLSAGSAASRQTGKSSG